MNKNKNLITTFNNAIKKLKTEGYSIDLKKEDADRISTTIKSDGTTYYYVGTYTAQEDLLYTVFIYPVEFDTLPIREGETLESIVNTFNMTSIGSKCAIIDKESNKLRFQNDHFYKSKCLESDIVEDVRYFIYDAENNVSYFKSIIEKVEFKK